MTDSDKINIRRLQDGNWYWVDKAVIQRYVPKIGAVAFVVYSYLASLVDFTQSCFPSQRHIAEVLGYSRATVSKSIKILKDNGLVCAEQRGGHYPQTYRLLRVRCKATETQVSTTRNLDVKHTNTNNNKIPRLINDTTAAEDKRIAADDKNFIPRTKKELLALDLAEALNDRQNLPVYLSYSKKYPESVLRRALGEVNEVPQAKIKKSRAALFNHLVQTYEEQSYHNSGN
jgi:biotin operon repressor